MWLHDGDDPAFRRSARGFQHRADLDGMVTVIVEYDRALPLSGARETPLDAAKPRKRLADRLDGHAELVSNGDRAGRIERVVVPRHRQP